MNLIEDAMQAAQEVIEQQVKTLSQKGLDLFDCIFGKQKYSPNTHTRKTGEVFIQIDGNEPTILLQVMDSSYQEVYFRLVLKEAEGSFWAFSGVKFDKIKSKVGLGIALLELEHSPENTFPLRFKI
jgi:hypothetical protein